MYKMGQKHSSPKVNNDTVWPASVQPVFPQYNQLPPMAPLQLPLAPPPLVQYYTPVVAPPSVYTNLVVPYYNPIVYTRPY